MQKLEKGIEMVIKGETVLVVGGIGFSTHDLVVGNQVPNLKAHSADCGCSHCDKKTVDFGTVTSGKLRIHHSILDMRQSMSTLSKTQKGTMAQESGVQPDPSPYEQIAFDFFRQNTYDPDHTENAILATTLETLVKVLSKKAATTLSNQLRADKNLPPLPQSKKWGEMNFTKTRQVVLYLPSALRTFLKKDVFDPDELNLMKHCIQFDDEKVLLKPKIAIDDNALVQEVMDCILAVGEMVAAVFGDYLVPDLEEKVLKGRRAVLRVWRPYFVDKPTIHIGVHYLGQAKDTGNLKNARVAPKENVHLKSKNVTKNSNKKNLEKDFLLHENQVSTLKTLLLRDQAFEKVVKDPSLAPIFRGWIFDDERITLEGKTDNLSKEESDQLVKCYSDHFNRTIIIRKKSTIFNVKKVTLNQKGHRMTYKLGDWIQLPYTSHENTEIMGNAKIEKIFRHAIIQTDFFFMRITWYDFHRTDTITKFPIWKKKIIDPQTKLKYETLFPLYLVDKKIMVTPIGTRNEEFLFNPNYNCLIDVK
jgi:hypothetical protein